LASDAIYTLSLHDALPIFDGKGNEVLEDAVILVRGNRIVETGSRSQIQIPEDAERIDASGMSILPGLIDAHLHTVNDNKVLNTRSEEHTSELQSRENLVCR